MQNPLDGATVDEIQNLIKSILGTFTTNYVKQYALGLVKKAEEEAAAEPGPAWQLLERPETDTADPLKTGWLMKKGAIRKSWKKRWVVVHPNYVVEYFENEKAAQGPKPKSKGKMFLSGYRVVEDPNAGIIQQLEKIAKQMNIDTSELPKPKQYPELVFELHHPRRRCYFIEASTKEEKQEWVDMFRTVCWYAWGLENRDPVHMKAFNRAIVETRWHLGRWGWWSSGGSETQLLSDLINDEIEYQTLGKIFAKIGGVPWIIRSKIRDQVLKTIDGFVSAGVTPAWAAMSKTVEELRPKIEPTIAQMVDPLGKQKAELINKMKDGCMSIIQPLLEQHVTPHLQKILEIIKSPVVKGYEQGGELLTEQFGKVKTDSLDASFKQLDQWSRWSWWEAKKATSYFDKMYEPLWALHVIFDDIYPWSTIYNGQDQLRKVLDNAIYTFEVDCKKAVEAKTDNPTDAKAVMQKYEADAKLATILYYLKIFKDIIMPAFNKTVIPACKAIIDPLSDIIPEPMKQFIDPSDMFDKFINALIDDTIKVILK